MFGSTVGMLNVFVNNKLAFQEHGNHGDRWIKGVVPLPSNLSDIQLMIEGTHGEGYTGDIALDDFSIGNSSECTSVKVVSCEGRCGGGGSTDGGEDTATCICTPGCLRESSCCQDYQEHCPSSDFAESSSISDYDTIWSTLSSTDGDLTSTATSGTSESGLSDTAETSPFISVTSREISTSGDQGAKPNPSFISYQTTATHFQLNNTSTKSSIFQFTSITSNDSQSTRPTLIAVNQSRSGHSPTVPTHQIPFGHIPTVPYSQSPSGLSPTVPNSQSPSGHSPTVLNSQSPSGHSLTFPNSQIPSGHSPTVPNSQSPSGHIPTVPTSQTPSGNSPTINTSQSQSVPNVQLQSVHHSTKVVISESQSSQFTTVIANSSRFSLATTTKGHSQPDNASSRLSQISYTTSAPSRSRLNGSLFTTASHSRSYNIPQVTQSHLYSMDATTTTTSTSKRNVTGVFSPSKYITTTQRNSPVPSKPIVISNTTNPKVQHRFAPKKSQSTTTPSTNATLTSIFNRILKNVTPSLRFSVTSLKRPVTHAIPVKKEITESVTLKKIDTPTVIYPPIIKSTALKIGKKKDVSKHLTKQLVLATTPLVINVTKINLEESGKAKTKSSTGRTVARQTYPVAYVTALRYIGTPKVLPDASENLEWAKSEERTTTWHHFKFTTHQPAADGGGRTEARSEPIYKTKETLQEHRNEAEKETWTASLKYLLLGLIGSSVTLIVILLLWLWTRQARSGRGRLHRGRLHRRRGSEGDVLYVSSEEMFDFTLARPQSARQGPSGVLGVRPTAN